MCQISGTLLTAVSDDAVECGLTAPVPGCFKRDVFQRTRVVRILSAPPLHVYQVLVDTVRYSVGCSSCHSHLARLRNTKDQWSGTPQRSNSDFQCSRGRLVGDAITQWGLVLATPDARTGSHWLPGRDLFLPQREQKSGFRWWSLVASCLFLLARGETHELISSAAFPPRPAVELRGAPAGAVPKTEQVPAFQAQNPVRQGKRET